MRWGTLLALGVILLVAAAAPAARAAPRWAHLTPPASPPAGFALPMAYDAATKQLVLLDSANGETWIWDGTTWTPAALAPSARPPTRRDAVMAYDAATKQLILFGGLSGNVQLGDTWSWNGSTWTQLAPATSPPPTIQASMAYDAATGQLVLFGGDNGQGGTFSPTNDTWTWNGTTWSKQAPATSPPARLGAGMGYDPATKQLLLFGGTMGSSFFGDTWSWDGSTWSKLSPATSPVARSFPALAYDSATGQMLLEAGANLQTGGGRSDTWTWSGSTWVLQTPASGVNPARYGAATADDPGTGQLVLFGGATNATTSIGDTWLWTPFAVQTASLPTGAVGERYSASLQAVAGVAPYTWSVSAGALPAGLSLSATGAITGTPTTAGSVTFTVKALDSTTTAPQQATRSFTVKINPAPQPAAWVGNGANSDVNAFALTATGNATPMARLSGALTGLNGIGALAFDSAGQLWVASANNDALEQFPPGANGNVAPSRVITGPDTGIVTPAGIAFDSTGRIYVTNSASNTVAIYPAGASGNTPPQRAISGPDTGLSAPAGITIDHAGHVWVANYGANTLTEYASNASGDASPLATIGGPSTELGVPDGLGQDSAGNLLVANFFGRSVLRFANAAPFGDVAPQFTISGPQSQLSSPQGVDVDAARRTYVADSDTGLAIFANGATTPATVLSGPATDLRAPQTVAVAPPLEVASRSLPRAAVGRRYRGRLLAILGKSPLRWRLSKGRLPPGLKLARSGRLRGSPRRIGRYRFTVTVRDSERPVQRAKAKIVLRVGLAPTVTRILHARGSRRGGKTATIIGTGFSKGRRATTVAFGRIRAPLVRCRSTTRCTVRTPPGSGTVRITVTVHDLSSAPAARARYTYTR